MCGIAGYVGRFEPDLLGRMNRAQGHRGPDGSGQWHDAEAGLAHVRLAILDLSPAGAQPMADATGRVIVSFNGEIYNYRELRAGLERAGVVFRSRPFIGEMGCLLYTSPSPRDGLLSRMPSSA